MSGIFPAVDAPHSAEDRMDLAAALGMRNYTSVETQKEDAGIEVERYEAKGFCKILPWEVIHQNFPVGTASKLALILKQKPDGSTKRRIVIDLRRSGGNARAEIPERIVLLRACDVIASARYLKAHETELPENLTRGPFEETTEFMLLDLKDAFCHFGLREKELCHAISPGLESGTGILWCAMLFGYTGAPLIMGRLSAAISRLVQSFMHPAEGQAQMYVDDLLLLLRGPREHRESILALVVYTLAAFGVQLSLDKGERGARCTGTTFKLHESKVTLGTPKKLLDEVRDKLDEWAKAGMLTTKEMRAVAGKLSWIAGITPRLRWAVASIYAVITAKDDADGNEQAKARARTTETPGHGTTLATGSPGRPHEVPHPTREPRRGGRRVGHRDGRQPPRTRRHSHPTAPGPVDHGGGVRGGRQAGGGTVAPGGLRPAGQPERHGGARHPPGPAEVGPSHKARQGGHQV